MVVFSSISRGLSSTWTTSVIAPKRLRSFARWLRSSLRKRNGNHKRGLSNQAALFLFFLEAGYPASFFCELNRSSCTRHSRPVLSRYPQTAGVKRIPIGRIHFPGSRRREGAFFSNRARPVLFAMASLCHPGYLQQTGAFPDICRQPEPSRPPSIFSVCQPSPSIFQANRYIAPAAYQ